MDAQRHRIEGLYDNINRTDPHNIKVIFDLAIDYADIEKLRELYIQYPEELERIKCELSIRPICITYCLNKTETIW